MAETLPLVLITHELPETWLSSLEQHCQYLIGPKDATYLDPTLAQHLKQAKGLLTLLTIPVTGELLAQAPQLQVVSNMAVGVDNIDLAACTGRGIPVGNTPGVLTEGTADLAMALLLASARRLPEASADARAGLWKTWSPTGWLGSDLYGATLGIIGIGKIGRAVARRAAGFGMRILGFDPYLAPAVDANTAIQPATFAEVLHQSDFISLHVPLTPDTRAMINAAAFQQMKPGAILINTSRGPVVQTADLTEALQQGWIRAAALDVTDPEPLPPDHPLYSLPNCLIVPHIGSATHHTRQRMAELACENLLAGLAGKPLTHCANPEVYDQKRNTH